MSLNMLRSLIQPKNFLLPLALVIVVAPGVTFLSPVFGYGGRWALLVLLAVFSMFSAHKINRLRPNHTLAMIAYVGWCMLTYAWSDVRDLSLMKLVALVLVVFSAFMGGHRWVAERQLERGLDFLWPYALLALVAWVFGHNDPGKVGGYVVVAGATGNPNFLGVIVATSTPIVFLGLYWNGADTQKRLLWIAILAVYIVILYQSVSRASYLVFVAIACGFLAAHRIDRKVFWAVFVVLITSIVLVTAPQFTGSLVQRNIVKNEDPDERNLSTRQQPWERSYDAAVAGGMFGIGYGVSIDQPDFEPGLTVNTYGREKGNSQLAIVEETGLVGLALYVWLIALLFGRLVKGFLASRNKDSKVMLGLVIGTLVGLTAHSGFEAWWVAPGSVEFVFFWVMAGAGSAMAQVATAGVVPRAAGLEERAPLEWA